MGTIIEFKNVYKFYESGDSFLPALAKVDLKISQGEFVVILGPSGAGKSTLLNLIGGLDLPTSGEIIVNGQHIESLKDDQLTSYRAHNVGFVFQFFNLIPSLTALENIELMNEIVDFDIDSMEVLDSVGLKSHANYFPSKLSGGQQQRVAIARALSKKPALLLCDEPTGALDSENSLKILKLLKKMSKTLNTTIIIVTHNNAISETADKTINIKDGSVESIIVNDKPKEVDELEL